MRPNRVRREIGASASPSVSVGLTVLCLKESVVPAGAVGETVASLAG